MSGRAGPSGRPPRRGAAIIAGILLLARGKAAGFAAFSGTVQGYLSSLAPLIAFPLAGTLVALLNGQGLDAIVTFLTTLCALLAPAVLSHLVAERYRVADRWLVFATAFNWCQWLIPVLALALIAVMSALVAAGLPSRVGMIAALGGLAGYGLWLHWFLARRGLGLSALRAVILVVLVNGGTLVLLSLPDLIASALSGHGS